MGGSPCFNCLDQFTQDAWQELKGQPFRDDAFTDQDWQRHLTWRRYIPEPSVSGVVALTLAPVWMWSVLVSLGLGLYATYAEPKGAPNVSGHKDLITPFSLTSFALSLLMLFKTNSSYSRWWEARTLWGAGYIYVRSILRLVISFVGRDSPHLVPPLYRWTAALMPALAAYLRQREHYLNEHLEGVLLPAELDYLRARLKGGIPPIAALQVMSRLLDQARLPDMERQQLENLLNQVDIVIGGCERILKQPVPYAYNRWVAGQSRMHGVPTARGRVEGQREPHLPTCLVLAVACKQAALRRSAMVHHTRAADHTFPCMADHTFPCMADNRQAHAPLHPLLHHLPALCLLGEESEFAAEPCL
ncbi:hypothetical protein ABPG75_005267 [Micractinium tetrahymenae]